MWRTALKSSILIIVLCPAVGAILSHGYLMATDTCNTQLYDDNGGCAASYDDSTWCVQRNGEDQETCEGTPGASGNKSDGEKWDRDCKDGGINTDHCVTVDTNCLQKYNCTYSSAEQNGVLHKFCNAVTVYTPEAWWQTPKATTPTCVPAG